MQVPDSAKLAMIASYVYLQEGNIAEGEQRINLAIRHALLRSILSIYIEASVRTSALA